MLPQIASKLPHLFAARALLPMPIALIPEKSKTYIKYDIPRTCLPQSRFPVSGISLTSETNLAKAGRFRHASPRGRSRVAGNEWSEEGRINIEGSQVLIREVLDFLLRSPDFRHAYFTFIKFMVELKLLSR
jgi:hypothetical protein